MRLFGWLRFFDTFPSHRDPLPLPPMPREALERHRANCEAAREHARHGVAPTLWVVGCESITEDGESFRDYSDWTLGGVFDSEAAARAECKAPGDFYHPVPLNTPLGATHAIEPVYPHGRPQATLG